MTDLDFESLLTYIRSSRSFDLTGYKRTTLRRRFDRRMQASGAHATRSTWTTCRSTRRSSGSCSTWCSSTSPRSSATRRRGRTCRTRSCPRLLAAKSAGSPIRVWSAGCASGEEAYTLAIVLAEALGAEAFLERVKIYGTDVDEDALSAARHGTFRRPPSARSRPTCATGTSSASAPASCSAGPAPRGHLRAPRPEHDAPISRLDLLVCRNTLMYFNAEAQDLILRASSSGSRAGYMFLGKAETVLAHSGSFSSRSSCATASSSRLTRRVPACPTSSPSPTGRRTGCAGGHELGGGVRLGAHRADHHRRRRDARRWPTTGPAMFRLGATDVGRAIQDLELSYRPVELRSVIQQVDAEGRPVELTDVGWTGPLGDQLTLRVIVTPIRRTDDDRRSAGVILTFVDETRHRQLEHELEARTASWRRRTRSSSPPTRSWRPRTRSSSPPSRSWRPRTRSSSRPTRSSRR